jgi:hypothetical protein
VDTALLRPLAAWETPNRQTTTGQGKFVEIPVAKVLETKMLPGQKRFCHGSIYLQPGIQQPYSCC